MALTRSQAPNCLTCYTILQPTLLWRSFFLSPKSPTPEQFEQPKSPSSSKPFLLPNQETPLPLFANHFAPPHHHSCRREGLTRQSSLEQGRRVSSRWWHV